MKGICTYHALSVFMERNLSNNEMMCYRFKYGSDVRRIRIIYGIVALSACNLPLIYELRCT